MDVPGSVAEWRSPDQAHSDTWLGRGARSVSETHFGAAVQGEARSTGEVHSDPRPAGGAHSAVAHSDEAVLRDEARGARLDSRSWPAKERNAGRSVQVLSRFGAPTSAQGLSCWQDLQSVELHHLPPGGLRQRRTDPLPDWLVLRSDPQRHPA